MKTFKRFLEEKAIREDAASFNTAVTGLLDLPAATSSNVTQVASKFAVDPRSRQLATALVLTPAADALKAKADKLQQAKSGNQAVDNVVAKQVAANSQGAPTSAATTY